jgi:O-antigen/teichoic acid export membrane protein
MIPEPPRDQTSVYPPGDLIRGGLLARNVLWNFVGQAAPLIVAVVTIPILIRGLGTSRFAILTIAWVVVGYFSLFDLGLGRALTQLIARTLAAKEASTRDQVYVLIWTTLALMLGLGLVGTLAIFALAPWLVNQALRVPLTLRSETLNAFLLLSLSIPVVIIGSGLRGILEALQRFELSNGVRIGLGVFTFLGPALVLPLSRSVVASVATLVAIRIIANIAYFALCLVALPDLRRHVAFSSKAIVPLLRFGGWMTISNVLSPLMVSIDRFVIGSVVSLTSVTYYATPYEAITKLWVVPGALTGVLFPAFSTSFFYDPARAQALFRRATRYLFLMLFPITLITVAFAHELLHVWLGAEFARHSAVVLQLLAVGIFLNSLAQVPFVMIQGGGRPDLAAKLHLAELPLYLVALFALLPALGIEGAAVAWTGRVALDMVVLFLMANKLLHLARSYLRQAATALTIAVVFLALNIPTIALPLRATLIATMLIGFFALAWSRGLEQQERALGLRLLRTIRMPRFS